MPPYLHPPIGQLNAHTLWAFTLASQLKTKSENTPLRGRGGFDILPSFSPLWAHRSSVRTSDCRSEEGSSILPEPATFKRRKAFFLCPAPRTTNHEPRTTKLWYNVRHGKTQDGNGRWRRGRLHRQSSPRGRAVQRRRGVRGGRAEFGSRPQPRAGSPAGARPRARVRHLAGADRR